MIFVRPEYRYLGGETPRQSSRSLVNHHPRHQFHKTYGYGGMSTTGDLTYRRKQQLNRIPLRTEKLECPFNVPSMPRLSKVYPLKSNLSILPTRVTCNKPITSITSNISAKQNLSHSNIQSSSVRLRLTEPISTSSVKFDLSSSTSSLHSYSTYTINSYTQQPVTKINSSQVTSHKFHIAETLIRCYFMLLTQVCSMSLLNGIINETLAQMSQKPIALIQNWYNTLLKHLRDCNRAFRLHKKCFLTFLVLYALEPLSSDRKTFLKTNILPSLKRWDSFLIFPPLVSAQSRQSYLGPGSNFRPQFVPGGENEYSSGSGQRPVTEGSVRLTGARNAYSGNVEIYHMGRWGSICDDDWDENNARVVCRQLGHRSAIRSTHDSEFGRASERFWLDNVNCQGNENYINECSSNGWGIHDCSVAEAAGAECSPQLSSSRGTSRAPSFTSVFLDTSETPRSGGRTSSASSRGRLPNRDDFEPENTDPFAHLPSQRLGGSIDRSNMRVRLAGGRSNNNEGRVEIDLYGNNRWGLVCGDGWMLMEANVTCTQLGLGFAKAAPQTQVFGGRTSDIIINGLTCRGTEHDLSECDIKEVSTDGRPVQCPGGGNIAGVVCGSGLPDLVPDMELLRTTAYIEDRQMFFLRCAMEENCLARSAYALDQNDYMWPYLTRRLLRFTSRIVNLGTSDFRPFLPKYLWEWHSCHMHYHSMDVFSHYDVTDRQGRRVAQGHKASFCLEDNECRRYSTHKYRCQNFGEQGISVGCSDVYEHNIDCQWVDITDVPPGLYYFKVVINPEFKVPEISFSNNAIRCDLLYTGLYVTVDNCTLGAP